MLYRLYRARYQISSNGHSLFLANTLQSLWEEEPRMPALWKWKMPFPKLLGAVLRFLYNWAPHTLPWYSDTDDIRSSGREGTEDTNAIKQAWQMVIQDFSRPSDDFTSWWQATGPSLVELLQKADYELKSQRAHLRFYSKHLVPRLGPWPLRQGQPNRWRSFLTDDFSPLEYSWSWNKGPRDAPKVRYTVELIGPAAGSIYDPFNLTAAVDTAQEIASNYADVDLTWFNHFLSSFVDPRLSLPKVDSSRAVASPSSVFLAFDLNHTGGIAMKAYLIPLKAEQTGVSRLTVVSATINALPSPFPSFSILNKFLATHPLGLSTSIVGVGVDCIHPSKARLRLYIRSPVTCIEKAVDMLTLDGVLPTLSSAKSFSNFRKLWYHLLSLPPDFSTSKELQNTSHPTGGILYSFDVKPGNAIPEAKIYVPVKHYAENDWNAFHGLTRFLEEEGKSQWIEGFERVLQNVGSRRWPKATDASEELTIGSIEWKKGRGMQTYVGVGFEKEDLTLTSYIAPRIFGGLQ